MNTIDHAVNNSNINLNNKNILRVCQVMDPSFHPIWLFYRTTQNVSLSNLCRRKLEAVMYLQQEKGTASSSSSAIEDQDTTATVSRYVQNVKWCEEYQAIFEYDHGFYNTDILYSFVPLCHEYIPLSCIPLKPYRTTFISSQSIKLSRICSPYHFVW